MDIFFAMSHGVHRGVLKNNFEDPRVFFLNELIKYLFEKISKIKNNKFTILFSPAAASFDEYKNIDFLAAKGATDMGNGLLIAKKNSQILLDLIL